jgi:hypothetical protein
MCRKSTNARLNTVKQANAFRTNTDPSPQKKARPFNGRAKTKEAERPDQAFQPIRSSITLSGLAPYFHETRLKIRGNETEAEKKRAHMLGAQKNKGDDDRSGFHPSGHI